MFSKNTFVEIGRSITQLYIRTKPSILKETDFYSSLKKYMVDSTMFLLKLEEIN